MCHLKGKSWNRPWNVVYLSPFSLALAYLFASPEKLFAFAFLSTPVVLQWNRLWSRNRREIEEARFCGAIIKLFVFATRWQKPKGRFASFLLLSATSTRFIYFVLRFAAKLMRHCVKLETLLVLSHFPYNMISNAERSFPCNNSWKCCNSDVDLLFMFLQKGKICNFPTMMSVFIRECTCLFIDSVVPFAGNLKITIKHVIKCC